MNQHKPTQMSIYLCKHIQLVGSCLVCNLIQSLSKVGIVKRVSPSQVLRSKQSAIIEYKVQIHGKMTVFISHIHPPELQTFFFSGTQDIVLRMFMLLFSMRRKNKQTFCQTSPFMLHRIKEVIQSVT